MKIFLKQETAGKNNMKGKIVNPLVTIVDFVNLIKIYFQSTTVVVTRNDKTLYVF